MIGRSKPFILMLGLTVLLSSCAKVAPNMEPVAGAYPRSYPYEPPDLYETAYPVDAEARDQMRRDDLVRQGALFYGSGRTD